MTTLVQIRKDLQSVVESIDTLIAAEKKNTKTKPSTAAPAKKATPAPTPKTKTSAVAKPASTKKTKEPTSDDGKSSKKPVKEEKSKPAAQTTKAAPKTQKKVQLHAEKKLIDGKQYRVTREYGLVIEMDDNVVLGKLDSKKKKIIELDDDDVRFAELHGLTVKSDDSDVEDADTDEEVAVESENEDADVEEDEGEGGDEEEEEDDDDEDDE